MKYKLFGHYFCDNCGKWFKTGCFLPGEKESPKARALYDDIYPKCGALVSEWWQCFPWYREHRKKIKYQLFVEKSINFLYGNHRLKEFRYSKYVGTLSIWIRHDFPLKWKRIGEVWVGYRYGKVYMVEVEDADNLIPQIDKMGLLEVTHELGSYLFKLKTLVL